MIDKRNKIYMVLLILFISFTVPTNVQAAKKYSDGYFEYVLEDSSVVITKYTGTSTELTIPSIIAGYPVSKIATGAFKSSLITKKINLPDTIMEIEYEAIAQGIEVIYSDNAAEIGHVDAERIGAPKKEDEYDTIDSKEAEIGNETTDIEGIKTDDGNKIISVNADNQLISIDKSGKTTVIDKTEKYELKKDSSKKTVEIVDSKGNKVRVDKNNNVIVDGKVKVELKDDISNDKKNTVIEKVAEDKVETDKISIRNEIWNIIGIVVIACVVIGGCGLVFYKKVYQKKVVSAN